MRQISPCPASGPVRRTKVPSTCTDGERPMCVPRAPPARAGWPAKSRQHLNSVVQSIPSRSWPAYGSGKRKSSWGCPAESRRATSTRLCSARPTRSHSWGTCGAGSTSALLDRRILCTKTSQLGRCGYWCRAMLDVLYIPYMAIPLDS